MTRRKVLAAGLTALAVAAVVAEARATGPHAPTIVAADCHWEGTAVRVSATVWNPNDSAEEAVFRPTFQLETGGTQGGHHTATVGRLARGRMAGRSFATVSDVITPERYDGRAGETIVHCAPSVYIPTGED